MQWWWCLALAGCKFTPGKVRDVDVDASVADDAGDDAPRVNCYDQWLDGTIRFGAPTPMNDVNAIGFYDRDPYLTADELQVFVSSGRVGGMGGTVWTSKRLTTTAQFPPPIVATSFETASNETKLSFTSDGTYAVIGSDLDVANQVDVWEATRASPSDTWSALGRGHLGAVNTPTSDHDPTISADGLRLYLAPYNGTYQYVAVATRADRSSSFSSPVELTSLTSTMGDADPSPTPDERIILFGSNRTTAGPMPPNVWYATRSGQGEPFGAPIIVPDINGDLPEGDPHLSADGCRIYFGREVDVQNYDWDIYVATALP